MLTPAGELRRYARDPADLARTIRRLAHSGSIRPPIGIRAGVVHAPRVAHGDSVDRALRRGFARRADAKTRNADRCLGRRFESQVRELVSPNHTANRADASAAFPLFQADSALEIGAGFARFPAWLIRAGMLAELDRHRATDVLLAIVSCLPGTSDSTTVRRGSLAKMIGACRRTVDNALRTLERVGVLEIRSGADRGRASTYRVRFAPPAAEPTSNPAGVRTPERVGGVHGRSHQCSRERDLSSNTGGGSAPRVERRGSPRPPRGRSTDYPQTVPHGTPTSVRDDAAGSASRGDAERALAAAGVGEPMRSRLASSYGLPEIVAACDAARARERSPGWIVAALRGGWIRKRPAGPRIEPSRRPAPPRADAALERAYALIVEHAGGDGSIALAELGYASPGAMALADPLRIASRLGSRESGEYDRVESRAVAGAADRLLDLAGVGRGTWRKLTGEIRSMLAERRNER